MPASGYAARKCFTAFAMEFTWPGVPVIACASIRPSASKTPAERSPASRTEVENAVRTSVCACSSATAMSRLHMICAWICDRAAFERSSIASPSKPRASYQALVKVPPVRIGRFHQCELLAARSSLDLFLPLDCRPHLVVTLVPDEQLAAVTRREARKQTFAMLPGALDQVGGDACIQRPVAFTAVM